MNLKINKILTCFYITGLTQTVKKPHAKAQSSQRKAFVLSGNGKKIRAFVANFLTVRNFSYIREFKIFAAFLCALAPLRETTLLYKSLKSGNLRSGQSLFVVFFLSLLLLTGCRKPDQDIVLRDIKDVVVDASTGPMLRANAIFFNPNKVRGRLKKIDVEIFVNGKKAASVDQSLKTSIPAAAEFTVPLEVKLALKDFGFMDTLLGMVGGRTFNIHYKGSLRLTYHGLPINVPVDYKDDVRIRF